MHIGRTIKDIHEKSGMKITEFARRIGKTSSNIYDIFERESVDTSLLSSISDVLKHDFFKYYNFKEMNVSEPLVSYGTKNDDKPYISITINNVPAAKVNRIFKQLNELLQ